jgi:serine/threonine-protein kinase
VTTDRWLEVKRLFADAVALPVEDRAAYVDRGCGSDAALRAEVTSLLVAYEQTDQFLEEPAASADALAAAGIVVTPRPPLEIGRMLGPYELVAPIGTGGMGEVYRARDLRLNRTVALKVLAQLVSRDDDARARFEREARTISSLNHPNICALYDVGRHEQIDFLVMEYLEGETLATRLEQGPLPGAAALECAIEIADALDAAHRHGVIHRDLKPSNVILTEHGAKLLDFGIAKLQNAEPTADAGRVPETGGRGSKETRLIGTVGYMSPEQARGEPVDARSDLFSFGAVLYEMATGRRRFPTAGRGTARRTDAATATQAGEADFSDAPPELAAVIRKALEADRERRYQHAADIRADLERVQRTWTGGQTPARSWRLTNEARAHPVVAALAASIVLVFAAWTAVLFLRGPSRATGAAAQPSVAVLPFQVIAGGDDEQGYIGASLAEAISTDLRAIKSVAVRPVAGSGRSGADPRAAGRALKADLVVSGAIQRVNGQLHLQVHLLRVADGAAVWNHEFNSSWTDVFRIQDMLASQVASALAVTLTGDDRQRVQRHRTGNVDAYEQYLRGRFFWNSRTPDGFRKALGYFQRAIEKDPNFAPAYAGLADTYALLGSMPYAVMPPAEAGSRAKAAAHQALAIDPTLAEAQVSLAFVTYSFDWDWAGGELAFRRALDLDPEYVPAHYWYSLYLGQLGRLDEALFEAERAVDLEPLSLVGSYAVGLQHYFRRRFDTAGEYASKTLEISPAFPPSRRLMGMVALAEGRHADAISQLRQLYEAAPENSLAEALLAYAYGRAGERQLALALVRDLVAATKTRFVPKAHIAIAYVGMGDRDLAFDCFEQAVVERSQALTFLKIDPLFDPVRGDPRFASLQKRVGF